MERGSCGLFYAAYWYNLKMLMEQQTPSVRRDNSPLIHGMSLLKSNSCALHCTSLLWFTPRGYEQKYCSRAHAKNKLFKTIFLFSFDVQTTHNFLKNLFYEYVGSTNKVGTETEI
jgi:hypothetical protein